MRNTSRSYWVFVVHQTNFINTLNEKGPLESRIPVEPRIIGPKTYDSFSPSFYHSLKINFTHLNLFPFGFQFKTFFINERRPVHPTVMQIAIPHENIKPFPLECDYGINVCWSRLSHPFLKWCKYSIIHILGNNVFRSNVTWEYFAKID